MGRTEGRSAADTRRLILAAAAVVISRDGVTATLDDIAAEAGVSKGGLVYHYSSKIGLLTALVEHLIETFRQEVAAAIDPHDEAPGRLARAYIRASLAGREDIASLRDSIALAASLMTLPEVHPLALKDAAAWRAELDADGLPDHAIQIIVAATDGVVSGPLWGSVLTARDVGELEQMLLEVTRRPDAMRPLLSGS